MRKPKGVKRTRTEITVEIDELMLVKRRRGSSIRIWCPECETEVMMIPAEQAAAAVGVSSRTIYRWMEEAKVHFTEEPGGSPLICAASLPANTRD